ncbi:MAG: hypothetical protein IJS82_03425 [Paludibacteraceae bacterium]|nr:hypothetical protein [Paludibacteraceae bacterium]
MASEKTPEGQWNYLVFDIKDKPHEGINMYFLANTDIHVGANISRYQSWHFDVELGEPCPVAPIIVEAMDEYTLTLRYRDQLYRLSMKEWESDTAVLERETPVTPNHAYTRLELRKPYRFTLTLRIERREYTYGSSSMSGFGGPPVFDPKTGRIVGVKTMQEVDHDAWEAAAEYYRTGMMPPEE